MTDVLTEIETLDVEQATRRYDEYRALAAKAATGELSDDDKRRLQALTNGEIKDVDRDTLRRDIDTLQQAAALEQAAANVAELRQRRDDIAQAAAGRIAQRQAEIDRLANENAADRQTVAEAEKEWQAAAEAEGRLNWIRRGHAQLFGAPDPKALAGKRHIWQGNPPPTTDGIGIVTIESLMDRYNVPPRDSLNFEFVPLEGQTAQQMADLLQLAREVIDIRHRGRRVVYLSDGPHETAFNAHAALIQFEIGGEHGNCEAIAAPGQSPEEFERLRDAYRRNYQKKAAEALRR